MRSGLLCGQFYVVSTLHYVTLKIFSRGLSKNIKEHEEKQAK